MPIFLKNSIIKKQLSGIKEAANLLWKKGWAEANAGNLSVNITKLLKNLEIDYKKSENLKTDRVYNHLPENYFLITSTGSRMRDISKNPLNGICLIQINEKGNGYKNIALGNNIIKPTSEILAHLEIHNTLSGTNSPNNTVLHTHPAEVIAITHLKKYCNEKNLNKLIYSIQPEVSFAYQNGIGFVPYYTTGSAKLATETGKKFLNHNTVLWEKHGCVSVGKDLFDAFDKIDILVKSLKIFFLCNSAGNKPEGISVNKLNELKKLLN